MAACSGVVSSFNWKSLDRKLSQIVEQQRIGSGERESRERLSSPIKKAMQKDDPAMVDLYEQQRKLEDNQCLLAELARIEQELRETLRSEEERQKMEEQLRQEENRQRWKSLCYLSLNQRTTKPWVTSYYKNIPMHIYCLPINSVHKNSKKKRKKKS